jgi:hypothetical protein
MKVLQYPYTGTAMDIGNVQAYYLELFPIKGNEFLHNIP